MILWKSNCNVKIIHACQTTYRSLFEEQYIKKEKFNQLYFISHFARKINLALTYKLFLFSLKKKFSPGLF